MVSGIIYYASLQHLHRDVKKLAYQDFIFCVKVFNVISCSFIPFAMSNALMILMLCRKMAIASIASIILPGTRECHHVM
jgi:hypothetical protein